MDKNEITIVENTYIAKDNNGCEESSLTAYCASVLSDDLKSIMSVKKEQSNTSDWIKVEDRLPEIGKRVLVCGTEIGRCVAGLDSENRWGVVNDVYVSPTHWMQLPEPPIE
jgi:hypothetical protein